MMITNDRLAVGPTTHEIYIHHGKTDAPYSDKGIATQHPYIPGITLGKGIHIKGGVTDDLRF